MSGRPDISIDNIFVKKEFFMSNYEHFIMPYRERKLSASPTGTPIRYVGTVVLCKKGSTVSHAKFDVYSIENWRSESSWITELKNGRSYFTNAIRSPETTGPLFDCDSIRVFAEEGYYFVDESGRKSLRHFNIKWWREIIMSYYSGSGKIAKTEEYLGNAEDRLYTGNSYARKGDYDKAIKEYDKAIMLNPRYVVAYHVRGIAYAEKGDYEKAIADYSEAIRLKPDNTEYRKKYAEAEV